MQAIQEKEVHQTLPEEKDESTKNPLTLLIDANNLICRMYYGLNKSSKKRGRGEDQTQVLRSIKYAIQSLVEQYQPQYVLAGIDDYPTSKRELQEGYKSRSLEKPEELRTLLSQAPELMRSYGAVPVGADQHEADDVLATLAVRAPGEVVILTGDHDLYATLSGNVKVVSKKEEMDEQRFIREFGIQPSQLPFYKALVGDSSDSMPGSSYFKKNKQVAALLVTRYQTPERLFKNLHRQENGAQQALRHIGQAELEKRILIHTLNTSAPIKGL